MSDETVVYLFKREIKKRGTKGDPVREYCRKIENHNDIDSFKRCDDLCKATFDYIDGTNESASSDEVFKIEYDFKKAGYSDTTAVRVAGEMIKIIHYKNLSELDRLFFKRFIIQKLDQTIDDSEPITDEEFPKFIRDDMKKDKKEWNSDAQYEDIDDACKPEGKKGD